jgi:hypothetical protein
MAENKEAMHKSESNPDISEARDHFRSARKEMRKSFEALMPAGFLERRRAARKEFLLGLRKMVDVAIERVEK